MPSAWKLNWLSLHSTDSMLQLGPCLSEVKTLSILEEDILSKESTKFYCKKKLDEDLYILTATFDYAGWV